MRTGQFRGGIRRRGESLRYRRRGSSDRVTLTGLSGSYISCPDAAPLDITGDLQASVVVAANDWTPGSDQVLFGKTDWYIRLQAAGTIWFVWVESGGVTRIAASTTALLAGLAAGATQGVRVELDVDNGSSQYAVTFKTSSDGGSWTTDRTVTGATGVTTVRANSSRVYLGAENATTKNFAGAILSASYVNGIGGTEVAEFTATGVNLGTYTDAYGNVWTVN